MQRITAIFTAIITFFLSIFGYLTPTEDFGVKTLSASSWNGKTVMFMGKEIDAEADCETVPGGKSPVYRFDTAATLTLKAKAKGFTYYGITYESTNDLKCEMKYSEGTKSHTEVFFLEKTTSAKTFYSYTEEYEKGKNITSLKFTNLNDGTAELKLLGFSVFNRNQPSDEIYIENDSYKIGVSMIYGGALGYMEYLADNVQAVKLADGTVKVDKDAKAKYGGELLTSHVNLINRYDSGRYIQQSYYGTNGKNDGYVCGDYNGTKWPYNPVQGGNLAGSRSRIIDYRVTDESIYVKCRPMDWAKSADDITSSYMEATYTLINDVVKCDCSFTDFSGYAARKATQEMPAVYFIEPLNSFAYLNDGGFVYENNLAFWGDHPEQVYDSDASVGGFFSGENGFGAGIYAPGTTTLKAGVFLRDKESSLGSDPSKGNPASYIAPVKDIRFESFKPINYSFLLAAGNAQDIAAAFENCDAI